MMSCIFIKWFLFNAAISVNGAIGLTPKELDARLDSLELKLNQKDEKIKDLETRLSSAETILKKVPARVLEDRQMAQCAYREYWGTIAGSPLDSIISYDKVYFSDFSGALQDTGFNISTGVYTAPNQSGDGPLTFMVTWSLQSFDDDLHDGGVIFLYKNGVRVDQSYQNSDGGVRDMGGRTLLMELDVGDTLYLHCANCYEMLFVNVCIIPLS